jgi:hypothetical protein
MRVKMPEMGRVVFVVALVTVALLAGRVVLAGGPDVCPLTGSLLGETLRGASPPMLVLLVASDLTVGLRRERARDSALPDDDIFMAVSASFGECRNLQKKHQALFA